VLTEPVGEINPLGINEKGPRCPFRGRKDMPCAPGESAYVDGRPRMIWKRGQTVGRGIHTTNSNPPGLRKNKRRNTAQRNQGTLGLALSGGKSGEGLSKIPKKRRGGDRKPAETEWVNNAGKPVPALLLLAPKRSTTPVRKRWRRRHHYLSCWPNTGKKRVTRERGQRVIESTQPT